jgi:uncharacterized protein (TIGR00255 family)
MTGFGRASVRVDGADYDIEARSVNHRHLDARVRTPRALVMFESDIKARIQQRIGRGKVDLSVLIAEDASHPVAVAVDLEVAREYARAAEQLAEINGLSGTLSVDRLVSLPGVTRLAEPELAVEQLAEALQKGADSALDALLDMRSREGAAIERDLLARMDRVEKLAVSIERRSGAVREAVTARLRRRTEQLREETGLLDEARLHQEIVIAADRLDITEELVRLRSHIEQFRVIVASGSVGNPVGRRLDFLM